MSPAPHPLEPDEHRRARHLFVLKSLTDRGYTLAMKAADKAETQLDAPEPEPHEEAPAPSAPNPHQTFERYVRCIRLLVSLEHRIAENPAATAAKRSYRPGAGAHKPAQPFDPRRPLIENFLTQATRNTPGRAEIRRAGSACIDEAIERDPARTVTAAEILFDICEEHGLHYDITKLPDPFLQSSTADPRWRFPDQAANPASAPRVTPSCPPDG